MTYSRCNIESKQMRRIQNVILGQARFDRRQRGHDEKRVLQRELLAANRDAGETGGGGEVESERIRESGTVDAVSCVRCKIAHCVCTDSWRESSSINEGDPNSLRGVSLSAGAQREGKGCGRTSSSLGREVIRQLQCTRSSGEKGGSWTCVRGSLRTLKNPERVIWPLQSTLSETFAYFKARGSIAGVSETPLGTV